MLCQFRTSSEHKSKLSRLQFVKLDQKESAAEMKKVLDTHLNLKPTPNKLFTVNFMDENSFLLSLKNIQMVVF